MLCVKVKGRAFTQTGAISQNSSQRKECSSQVTGRAGAQFKSFNTLEEATAFLQSANVTTDRVKPVVPSPLVDADPCVCHIYTDGACRGNGTAQARAGYGVYYGPNDPRNISERLSGVQTNNRAELTAVIRAMESLDSSKKTIIHTDSIYVKKGMQEWMAQWKKRDWKTSQGTSVLNQDLWMSLDLLLEKMPNVEIQYVQAHAGIAGNEAADQLAVQGSLKP